MSWINSIFKPKPQGVTPGFINPITTEIHSHLIPAVDDGVQTLEHTIEILTVLEDLGYDKVITTPHIMGDFYKNSASNLLPARDTVRQALQENGLKIRFDVAAEYMIDEAFVSKVVSKQLLTFGDAYVLIEMPFDQESMLLKEAIFELQLNGYTPVLAHPERYMYYAMNRSRYEDLYHQGIKFQLNMFSLLDYYSPEVRKAALHLIDQKWISFIGTDIHAPRHLAILEQVLRTHEYERLCATNTLLNNTL